MSDPVVLGIDIAKQKFDAALVIGGKLKHKSCKNSSEGFDILSQWLRKQGVDYLHACLEAVAPDAKTIKAVSGTPINVAANGTFDIAFVGSTHWVLQFLNSGFYLNDLSGSQPEQTIIGATDAFGIFSNANNSIAGNDPHNPFLSGPVFSLSAPQQETTYPGYRCLSRHRFYFSDSVYSVQQHSGGN